MPYAVDNVWFQKRLIEAAADRKEFRRQLGIEPDQRVVLFAAKFQRRKRGCLEWIANVACPPLVDQRCPDAGIAADSRRLDKGNIASVNPRTKSHVSLMFHTGAAIPGEHPLLQGGGDKTLAADA